MGYGAPAVSGLSSSSSSSSPSRGPVAGAAVSLFALLFAAFSATAAPYAPRDFDFGEAEHLDAALCGVVEGVRETASTDLEPLAEVFEHAVGQAAEELRVRLDDGSLVVVVWDGAQRFQPGARVRLLHGRVFPS
ncbi:MAG TPA: hypothetical protein VGI18_06080 [Burkholderiales bacterium]|jgi:hypothetical protein